MTKKDKKKIDHIKEKLMNDIKFPQELNALELVAVTLKVQQKYEEMSKTAAGQLGREV